MEPGGQLEVVQVVNHQRGLLLYRPDGDPNCDGVDLEKPTALYLAKEAAKQLLEAATLGTKIPAAVP